MTAKLKQGILLGSLIGAILGAGIAYLFVTHPPALPEGEEPEPLTGSDLLSLTAAASVLIRKFDDIRRRL